MSVKNVLVINSLLVGMSFNYICFNQDLPGLFFGMFALGLAFFKFYRIVDYSRLCITTVFNFSILMSLVAISKLISCNYFIIVAIMLVSINAAMWFSILDIINLKDYDELQPIFTYLLLGFYTFAVIVMVMPNQYLNYFLYPHYIDGGFKLAMFVVIFVIFMPTVISNSIVSLYRYKLVKSKLMAKCQ